MAQLAKIFTGVTSLALFLVVLFIEDDRITHLNKKIKQVILPSYNSLTKDIVDYFSDDIEDYYSDKTTSFFMYSPQDSEFLADYQRCLDLNKERVIGYSNFKEGGEVHFLKQLETSAMRTSDMSSTNLIVVPIHFGLIARYGTCRPEAVKFLGNITMSQKHVVMSTEWKANLNKYGCTDNCIQMNSWIRRRKGCRCEIVAPMMSMMKLDHYNSSLLVDWRQRRYIFYFGGQADRRWSYTSRRRALAAFERIKNRTSRIEYFITGPKKKDAHYVERVLNTKIGLHIRGDSLNSNRLFEWIEVEAFVVMLANGFYDEAAPGIHIPWTNFTIQIDEKSTDAELDSQLIEISNIPEEVILKKLKIMNKFKKRILWNVPDSKVAETLLIDAAEKCT